MNIKIIFGETIKRVIMKVFLILSFYILFHQKLFISMFLFYDLISKNFDIYLF
jgi:F0F1-type ATP synthase assembly protein I